MKQDGPSSESSLYLNVTLRYLCPWDPWTLGPLDLVCLLAILIVFSNMLHFILLLIHIHFMKMMTWRLILIRN